MLKADIPNPFSVTVSLPGSSALNNVATALDIENGLYLNATQYGEPPVGRIITNTYAHRSKRSLLIFEVRAEIAVGFQPANFTVNLDRCNGHGSNAVDWTTLADFDGGVAEEHAGPAVEQQTLTVKVMEANCDVGHYTPGKCNNTAMPPLPKTMVGLAYQPIPKTISLFQQDNYTRYFVASFRTSLEPGLEARGAAAAQAAKDVAENAAPEPARGAPAIAAPADALLASNAAGWAAEWEGGIEVAGNLTIAASVNSSLYYILASTRADWPHGLSPGGLARDDYEGHSFWDCETWMFPNMVALFPAQAYALTEYRRVRLPAARQRAASHGYGGAMQPWESALTGFGTSSVPTNDDKEIHISGDVANAFRLYYIMTRNDTWLKTHAWPLIRDTATFYTSRVTPWHGTPDGKNLTLVGVISPDESAGVHNSSAYNNAIAMTTLEFAIAAADIVGEQPGANWSSVAERMYIPLVKYADGFMAGVPVHPEYEGYDQKKRPHINQADVTLLQYPLGLADNRRLFPLVAGSSNPNQIAINDLLFWQPKSDNQIFYTGDSSNSIAWLALGNRSAADAQFDLAFTHINLGYFNVWEEKNYGDLGNLNFITGAGGYLQNYVNGYAGLRYSADGVTLRPVVPPNGCTSLALRGLSLAGARLTVHYTDDVFTATLTKSEDGAAVSVGIQGGSDQPKVLHVGDTATFAIEQPGQTVFLVSIKS